jgi:hypothetical protein
MIVPAELPSVNARATELALETSSIAGNKAARIFLMFTRQSIKASVKDPGRFLNSLNDAAVSCPLLD